MNNRKYNSKNPYQTAAKRVLCVCSAGLLRSPTTANVLHKEFGYNTRAAGVEADFALIPVDKVLLEWADEIVCVSPEVAKRLVPLHEEYPHKVVVLNIPDNFEWNDPELCKIISEQYRNADAPR